MDNEIRLTVLDESSLVQQVNIYRAAFNPTSDVEENIITWRKKHFENPLGNSIIIGAYIENQLVGMNAYMPIEYCVNGNKVKMLQSCESGVLPNFQGKGIWKKVVTFALNYISQNTDYQLVIGFPNYINSYPGFKKMGWKTVSNMKNYVLVNNLSALKTIFRDKNIVFRLLINGIIIQRAKVLFDSLKKENYIIEKIPIEQLLWNKGKLNELVCEHSDPILRWKQDYKRLFSICIKTKGQVVATCLYGLSTYNGSTIIKIESFNIQPSYRNKEKNLLATFLEYFSRSYPDVSFIRVWAQEKTERESLLKGLLFMSSSHPNPFITSNPDSVFSNMLWSLSFFDLD